MFEGCGAGWGRGGEAEGTEERPEDQAGNDLEHVWGMGELLSTAKLE